ncbi:MAG: hypothetical protein WCI92_19660, partial [Bacteroidota bacterium]
STIPAADISGNITGNAANVTGTVAIANGGTGATTAATARTSLGAAASGANGDITSLTNLTTDLPLTMGGTGASTAAAALTNILPTQTGNSGDVLTTDGTTASWQAPAATTLEYAMAGKNATQYGVLYGDEVIWNTSYLRGGITMSGNSFLLKAGKTYELECALGTEYGAFTIFGWVDASNNNVGVVYSLGKCVNSSYSNTDAAQTVAKAVITPAANMYVKVRLLNVTGTGTDLKLSYCWATVRQLP